MYNSIQLWTPERPDQDTVCNSVQPVGAEPVYGREASTRISLVLGRVVVLNTLLGKEGLRCVSLGQHHRRSREVNSSYPILRSDSTHAS